MAFFASRALLVTFLASCGGAVEGSGDGDRHPGPARPGAASDGTASTPTPADDTPPCTVAPLGVEQVVDLRTSGDDLGTTTGRIVVDERYVYADTNRGLFRAPKCGGGRAVRIADNSPGQYSASGLVQDSTFLYLAATAPVRGGFIRRVAKNGGSVTELAASTGELFGLALARSRLYWVEKGTAVGTLRAMAPTDTKAETIATVPIAYSYGPFTADESGVTFFAMSDSNRGSFYVHPWTGIRLAGTGSTPYEMVGGGADGGLYFTFGHTGANGIARLPGGDRVAPATAPCGLASAGGSLYWTDMSLGTVNRCSIADGPCESAAQVASGEDDPRHLTVDETGVYWATRRGLVKRAPR